MVAIRIPNYNLVGTFLCEVDEITPMKATLRIDLINYSEADIRERENITLFTSFYSETTKTVSVFTRDDGNERSLTTRYGGIRRRQVRCSRFHDNGSRLLCHLASSAAEIAYFTSIFPPRPLRAIGNFVRASTDSTRNTFTKITLVDSRLDILQPGNTQITYPSTIRFALLSRCSDEHISAGTMFIHVSIDGEEYEITENMTVETTWGSMVVPNDLVANIQALHPGDDYLAHMKGLMMYVDMAHTQQREGCENAFLTGLMNYDVHQIIEVIMVGMIFLMEQY